jgi:hypothetical protein
MLNKKERMKNMWVEYNPSPTGRRVGDCAVRAIAKALDTDWERAYIKLCVAGFGMGDMPSSDSVWGSVLRQNGFYKAAIDNDCKDCYTADDFCKEHWEGTYVLGFGGHVATVVNGDLYDSWDSSNEIPIYVWYRKENE